ncbi:hypothetical protein SAMN05421810_1041, partial [Amycolatopsis arida]
RVIEHTPQRGFPRNHSHHSSHHDSCCRRDVAGGPDPEGLSDDHHDDHPANRLAFSSLTGCCVRPTLAGVPVWLLSRGRRPLPRLGDPFVTADRFHLGLLLPCRRISGRHWCSCGDWHQAEGVPVRPPGDTGAQETCARSGRLAQCPHRKWLRRRQVDIDAISVPAPGLQGCTLRTLAGNRRRVASGDEAGVRSAYPGNVHPVSCCCPLGWSCCGAVVADGVDADDGAGVGGVDHVGAGDGDADVSDRVWAGAEEHQITW